MRQRRKCFVLVLAVIMLLFIGCAEEERATDEEYELEDGVVTVTGPEIEEHEFSVSELTDLDAVQREIVRERDDGTETFEIGGVSLQEVLAEIDLGGDDVKSIRLKAADGYSVQVPADVLQRSEPIFAYERDGAPLSGESGPVRAYVPGEETMYWVSNLVEIEILAVEEEEQSASVSEIVFLETLVSDIPRTEAGSGEEAASTRDVLDGLSVGDSVFMAAADGFEKNEEYDIFIEEYIQLTGDNTPAFRGPDLPRGMHVRDLVWFATGEVAVLSAERAPELFTAASADAETGVSLDVVLDALGLSGADDYVFEAMDGYTVEVSAEDLEIGIVYVHEEGVAASVFEGLPRNTAVRGLLSIRAAE